jgi:hypothetical protein
LKSQVTLANGVGFGESMVQYGGRPLSDSIIKRVSGKPPRIDVDDWSARAKMALFDAVTRRTASHSHLMGHKVRDRAFLELVGL